MKKVILVIAILCGVFNVNAQSELNAYKYIIVEKQYGFQKSADKHQLNSLTKFLLTKSNLNVLFDTDEFPDDLAVNACLGLKVELLDGSGMFNTQLSANFRDCKNQVIYTSPIGKSKVKEYKQAYHAAIRQSFEVFENYKYNYTGSKSLRVVAKEVINEQPKVDVAKKVAIVKKTEVKIAKKIVEAISKTAVLGTFSNGSMSFLVRPNGDHFELIHPEIGKIADLYKTSNTRLFIVQWLGKSQAKLVKITSENTLKIDTDSGVKIYVKKI